MTQAIGELSRVRRLLTPKIVAQFNVAIPRANMRLRRSLRSAFGRRLCHRRDRDRTVNARVDHRVGPGHDIADETERQVCGTECDLRHLWILLRLRIGTCPGPKVSVCRLPD